MSRCIRPRTDAHPGLSSSSASHAKSFARFLLERPVADFVPASLRAGDLAKLSTASGALFRFRRRFVANAAEAQHTMRILDGSLADLCALQCVPLSAEVDFTRDGLRVVQRGSPFSPMRVGGRADSCTFAQAPPAQGDRWFVTLCLQRGRYAMEINGWRNLCHGVLDLYLDGVRISPVQGVDWLAHDSSTSAHAETITGVRIRWTGAHRLLAEVSRTNSTQESPNNYWMCLRSLKLSLM